jgi:hypothetical protein
VLGHLRLEHLLEHSLDDLPEEVCVVEQKPLAPSARPAYDDLWSSSLLVDRLTLGTNHLGGRWPLFLADRQFTELYGHNRELRSMKVASLWAEVLQG